MNARRLALGACLSFAALVGAPAVQAEVVQSSASGFVVAGTATTAASAADVWYLLIEPGEWWSGEHTWSGDAGNLRLDPAAGGCFCEDLVQGGSVEHMRVIYAAPGEMLRMSGALGPLQSEGVAGTLTIELSEAGEGTQISWTYSVGGYSRVSLPEIAGTVDMVMGEQMRRLADLLKNPQPRL